MIRNEIRCSLLIIIVSRGKGSSVLSFAREHGAKDASCLLGQGTVNSRVLQLIEMNDVEKEIILIVVPTGNEDEILHDLNKKFHFERKNHGIAFTVPLAGIMEMKRDSLVKWADANELFAGKQFDYSMLLVIVDKGKAENVVHISQTAGYFGGTVIKARGICGDNNVLLDMIVKQEKEAVLILIKRKSADHLISLLNERLSLGKPGMGFLYRTNVNRTIGLFENDKQEGELS